MNNKSDISSHMNFNSYLHINLCNFMQNVNEIISELPDNSKLIPVLKCNAYGCGIAEMAKLIDGDERIPCFAVAQGYEALALRNAGIKKDVLIIGSIINKELIIECAKRNITPALCSLAQADILADTLREESLHLNVHIAVNTGLNRMGVSLSEVQPLSEKLKNYADVLSVKGTYSHAKDILGNTDALAQYELLLKFTEKLRACGIEPGMIHFSASALFEKHPEFSLDAVRIGRRLYMDAVGVHSGRIKEVASWRVFIEDIAQRKKGDSIGYGDKCTLERDSDVAMLGVGYGDSLINELVETKASVLINGQRAPIIATCMDVCFVDVTGIQCRIGDEATVFGYDAEGNFNSSQDIASQFGEEGCTLTAALGDRVKRIYE